MISFPAFAVAVSTTLALTFITIRPSAAQSSAATEKLNAYVGCIDGLSERAFD
jgi:hypothetical protein